MVDQSRKEIDRMIRRLRREMNSVPLCEPCQDEFVGDCHWSRTGFAIWKKGDAKRGNYCTCRPAVSQANRGDT